jgi:Flp pilus assembly protein TadG
MGHHHAMNHNGREQPAMRRRPARSTPRDRGAAAVEFALLLPMLLLLVFGIIDFGRALNAQITLTQAAREGARLASLGQSSANVSTATTNAATGLKPVTVTVTTCQPSTGTPADGTVKVSYKFTFVTPLAAISGLFGKSSFGSAMTLTATGVMPCET